MADYYRLLKPGADDISGETVRFPVERDSRLLEDTLLEEIAASSGARVNYGRGDERGTFLLVHVRKQASLKDVAESAKAIIVAANKRYQAEVEKYHREDEEQRQVVEETRARAEELRSQLDDLQL